jgi:hypothetical protein
MIDYGIWIINICSCHKIRKGINIVAFYSLCGWMAKPKKKSDTNTLVLVIVIVVVLLIISAIYLWAQHSSAYVASTKTTTISGYNTSGTNSSGYNKTGYNTSGYNKTGVKPIT